MSTRTPADWNRRYRERDMPWDSGLPSRELVRILDEQAIAPCRMIELGCGTGTNAVYLARRGFDVTVVDVSALALDEARQKAAAAEVTLTCLEADVTQLPADLEPFDFIFDRGCYHCVRRFDLSGFLAGLVRLTRPGTRYVVLTGNANEQTEHGPPRLHEHEIRDDLEPYFDVHLIREIRFQDPGGVDGPLGWSCFMTRRDATLENG